MKVKKFDKFINENGSHFNEVMTQSEFNSHMINESSFDQLEQQFVKSGKLDQATFDDIKDNIHKSAFATWLISKVSKNYIESEDIYKYNGYFNIFDRYKNEYKHKDINAYKSKEDISDFIKTSVDIKRREDADTSTIKGVSKDKKYDQFKIGEVRGFDVYELPHNRTDLYNVSCDLGSGTEWCTATGNTRSHFDEYIKGDSIYIFIKDDIKYQFHYKTHSFMDRNDLDVVDEHGTISGDVILDLFVFLKDKKGIDMPINIKVAFDMLTDSDAKNMTEDDWEWISQYTLPEKFIRKYQDKLYWNELSITSRISIDFIREFKDKINWNGLRARTGFWTEDLIREFITKVDWSQISMGTRLSEDFIREFKDKLNWDMIYLYQDISDEFIKEFRNEGYITDETGEGYFKPNPKETWKNGNTDNMHGSRH